MRALELADGQRPSVRQQILRDAAVLWAGRRGWKVKTSEKPVATFSTWNSSTWTVVVFGFGHENKPQRNYGDKRAIVPKWFQVEAEKQEGEEGRRSE